MDVQRLLDQACDVLTVKRVYGDPVEAGGVTVIPAARVRGGGGGGEGQGGDRGGDVGAENEGSGGGFGLDARPVGAYVIRDGKVSWQPAVDVNRVVLGAQVTAVIAFFVLRRLLQDRGGATSAPPIPSSPWQRRRTSAAAPVGRRDGNGRR